MPTGVKISKGLQDWQIIQQGDGYSQIKLSGIWALSDAASEILAIHVRVVVEDTGSILIPWTQCENYGKNRWKVTLRNIPAGGLYRIETSLDHSKASGIRGDMVHHIGVGDLFVIAGQSNAAGYGRDPVMDPPEIGVHAFKSSGKWDLASHPLSDSTGSKPVAKKEMGIPGHSPYLCFARILKRELGYPIGLIQTALGGSALSSWNPGEDGYLYKNMLERVKAAGNEIKAMLWYQGCADAAEGVCDTYLERFENMVSHLRSTLVNKELPVMTVQINRYVVPASDANNRGWGKLRDVQRRAAKLVPKVFVIPANDCTLSDAIHNAAASNLKLGERLANSALANIYGRKYVSEAPDISKAVKLEDNQIQLLFDNVKGKIYTFEVGSEKLPFTVVDEKGQLEITGYEINSNNGILLTMNREAGGSCVIHGVWQQNPGFFIPIDDYSHIPVLSFYGVEVE